MLTTIQIDRDLLENARQLGGHRTGEEAVNEALREYVQRQKRLDALRHFGAFDFDPEYDHKKERKQR
jgi:Arc/MetJ family transcription regulator